jgi:hypothetical protein
MWCYRSHRTAADQNDHIARLDRALAQPFHGGVRSVPTRQALDPKCNRSPFARSIAANPGRADATSLQPTRDNNVQSRVFDISKTPHYNLFRKSSFVHGLVSDELFAGRQQ